ncbi:MAG: hypothetical protein V2J65_13385 [Desulfobacteraceae bacterium]|jgi:hypothetical protein|nr:hypothetical protein [Desulfobacteraceae bacterium]
MKNPTVWSIYKNVRLSIQNSEATAFIAMSILEDLYDKGSTVGGAAFVAWRVMEDIKENLGCTLKATAVNGC